VPQTAGKAARAATAESAHERALPLGILLVWFFLSGATALVYEVVWLRMLGLVFGHTVHAITTVLAAFMAGLGLGSALLGRRAARFRDPIRVYGLLEVGIGLACGLVPVLIWLASFVYVGLYRGLAMSYTVFGFVQFVLVFALLLIPTTLMGGTLPVLSQAAVRTDSAIARTVGTLYAVNTFGAVVGVFLSGYVLLPALGNRATLVVAVVANLAVGITAIAFSRTRGDSQAEAHRKTGSVAAVSASAPGIPAARDIGAWFTLGALGVSGAISMVYEVAWTRALAQVIGSSTYAFSAMLLAFLLGIAGGAALYSLRWARPSVSVAGFAAIQCGIGLAAAAALMLFGQFPDLVVRALAVSATPAFVNMMQFVISAGALLPSTLLIGATFPCAVAVWARASGRTGEDVGYVYAASTVGAIVGTVATGFMLVPAYGVQASIKLGILLNLLLAVALSIASIGVPGMRRWGTLGTALVAAVGVMLIQPWNLRTMSSGPAIYAQVIRPGPSLDESLAGREVIFYRDGASATVSVTRDGDHVALRVNGKTDASNGPADMPIQLMLGHLPFLLHPHPRTVLVIGLGTGISASAVARHPIERLDVVEIEPAVVEASRFFAELNGDVLKDPRVRLTIADGRNFLLTTSNRYDVIASEPSNPWLSGVAPLFSLEFFQLARRHLRPGGIMVQWVQAYSLTPEDLRMIVRTFRTVFPATTIWHLGGGDFQLVGRMESVPFDLNLLKARYKENPALRADLARIGMSSWAGVLGFFMLDERGAERYADGAPLNTDDRLALEFSTPRALFLDTIATNWRLMRSFRMADLPDLISGSRADLDRPEVRAAIGETLVRVGALGDARRYLLGPSESPPRVPKGR
jgi:spermidine synthase